MKRIICKIKPNGEVTVETEGFTGTGCQVATEAMLKALGTVIETTEKPEYYEQLDDLETTLYETNGEE